LSALRRAWLFLFVLFTASCASFQGAASAEEYYSLGMAYFELGKYEEAERWLIRARTLDKTKAASEYNLGRIAFERGRYEEALRYFNRILDQDPQNILALKAAAYTRIKTGGLIEAEALYARVLALVPESADDGYNYGLILFALDKYEAAEAELLKYPYTIEDNADAVLLLARSQNKQEKPEALDNYAKWLQNNTDANVRYEYAQLLEKEAFYARALEEYRSILVAAPMGVTSGQSAAGGSASKGKGPERQTVRFALARLLLKADSGSGEWLKELGQAVAEGFADADALESLLEEEGLDDEGKEEIRKLAADIRAPPEQPKDADESGAAPEADSQAPPEKK
jgi:tetratricopeptide (TPR) repeat protein